MKNYGDIFVPSDHDTPTIRRIRDEIHLSIQVNFEHPDIAGSHILLCPKNLMRLAKIDSIIDDRRDALEEILTITLSAKDKWKAESISI